MRDTLPDAERVLAERRRRQTPGERIEEGLRAANVCREVMRAGIRARHPEYDAAAVEDALARILWGDELFQAVHPRRPLRDP